MVTGAHLNPRPLALKERVLPTELSGPIWINKIKNRVYPGHAPLLSGSGNEFSITKKREINLQTNDRTENENEVGDYAATLT